jgi:hypothetical protein
VPRPKTSPGWIGRIWTLAANRKSATDILAVFEAEAEHDEGRRDYPLKRTIERQVKAFHALDPKDQRNFAEFHWPDSMLNGLIPWEASGQALDLLRYFDEARNDRPTVRATLWYWRVKQARPEMSLAAALTAAASLCAFEMMRFASPGDRYEAEPDELKLAYQPWRSNEDARAYTERTGENPMAMMRDLTDPRVHQEVMEASFGFAAADRLAHRRAEQLATTNTREGKVDDE